MSDENIEDLSFEQAMRALDAVVNKLERGETELEEAINLYEKGQRLKAHCDARLRAAELKVEKITQGADGAASGAVPFDAQ